MTNKYYGNTHRLPGDKHSRFNDNCSECKREHNKFHHYYNIDCDYCQVERREKE